MLKVLRFKNEGIARQLNELNTVLLFFIHFLFVFNPEFTVYYSSHTEVFYKKGVPKNFAKFVGK